jgi:hypothetical protein
LRHIADKTKTPIDNDVLKVIETALNLYKLGDHAGAEKILKDVELKTRKRP